MKFRTITPKDLKRKSLKKHKSVYLKTPHETVKLGEDGNAEFDEDGEPIFIPVIHKVPQYLAIEKIRKGTGEIEVDEETGELLQSRNFAIATKEEAELCEDQARCYRNKRNREIHARGLKRAKHIIQVSQESVAPKLEPNTETKEDADKDAANNPDPNDIVHLRKVADDLGLTYAPNIGAEKLKERIKEAIEEAEQK